MAHLDSASRTVADPEVLLAGYKPRPNNFDEMMDRNGRCNRLANTSLFILGATPEGRFETLFISVSAAPALACHPRY